MRIVDNDNDLEIVQQVEKCNDYLTLTPTLILYVVS